MVQKNTLRESARAAVAFCVPVALYLLVMAALRIVPFGDRTLLLWDADGQYCSFLAALRGALLGENDWLYSFSRLLGSGTPGLFAYYLASPVNLLVVFFSVENLPLAFSVIVLIKLGLCGLSFSYYLHKTSELGWKGLLFSTGYGLMGYTAIYFWDIMWLDAVILLPLIVLGLRRLLDGGKPFLYTVCLGLALFCNYYIGFMLCLFAVLYFLCGMMLRRIERKPVRFQTVGRFALASLLAGGLAAVLLLPAFLALQKGNPIWWNTALRFSRENAMLDLFTKFYTGAVDYDQLRYGLPNLYIGIPMLALAGVYFLHPAVPKTRKLHTALLLGVFVISFCVHFFYMLWHGFDSPNCMPARFSFLFSFLLIDAAAQGFKALTESKLRLSSARAVGLAVGFLMITAVLFRTELPAYLAYETVAFDVIVFLCTVGLLSAMDRKGLQQAGTLLLCAMQFGGLALNAYFCVKRLDVINEMRVSEYQDTVSELSALTERIKSEDDGLYRMEKNFARSENDALLFDYAGLSHYSSDVNRSVNLLGAGLGFHHAYLYTSYDNGATPVLDGLFSVKYLLWKKENSLADAPVGFVPLWKDGDVTAYENLTAMPFAFLAAAPEMESFSLEDPFDNQNQLLSDLTGTPVEVFTKDEAYSCEIQGNEMRVTLPVAANQQLYLQTTGAYFYWNDGGMEDGHRFSGCVALPLSEKDEVYQLTALQSEGVEPSCLVYRYHADEWQRAYEALQKCDVSSDTDSHLTIRAVMEQQEGQLVFTLPYDEGWQVTVDGKRMDTVSRYGALLAVELSMGEHMVELRYIPAGLLPGAVISVVSLLSMMGWAWLCRRKARVHTSPRSLA